jgi:hypothetical protein
LAKGFPSRFTAYFEIDRSFDGNDWWTDQPAVVYAADVDLSGGQATRTFALSARGWSINNDDQGGANGGNGTAFGAAYAAGSAEDATNMVGSLSLTATRR